MKKISLVLILTTLFLVACSYEDSLVTDENNFENYEEGINERNNEEIVNQSFEEISLKEFNDCLAENGMVIYGANWCGFCTQLINLLGGKEKVENVYVECTENQELCQYEGITGYPTIKIDNQVYRGQRTLESFSEATGCELTI